MQPCSATLVLKYLQVRMQVIGCCKCNLRLFLGSQQHFNWEESHFGVASSENITSKQKQQLQWWTNAAAASLIPFKNKFWFLSMFALDNINDPLLFELKLFYYNLTLWHYDADNWLRYWDWDTALYWERSEDRNNFPVSGEGERNTGRAAALLIKFWQHN